MPYYRSLIRISNMTENGRFAKICIYNSAMRVVEETIIEIQ